MYQSVHQTVIIPTAFVSCLLVGWSFAYGVYITTQPTTPPPTHSVEHIENNLEPNAALTELHIVDEHSATEPLAQSTESLQLDNQLVLTPLPEPSPTLPPVTHPTPTPLIRPSIAPAQPSSSYDPLFEQWSAHFGVDSNLLKHIAQCESRFNATSVGGIYGGMYQFSASTWKSTRNAMQHDPDPLLRFDANEAIKTAAFKIANGGQSAWKNCLPK